MRNVGSVYGAGVDRFSSAMDRVWHRVLGTGASTAVLAIRLAFGILFFAHGAQKLFGWFGGHGIAGTGAFLEQSGFAPGVLMAVIVGLIEFFGGIFLVLGLATRLASLGLMIVMAVAMFAVHWKNGLFISDGGIEFTLALIAGLLATFIYGAGQLSLDRTLWQRYLHRRERAELDEVTS